MNAGDPYGIRRHLDTLSMAQRAVFLRCRIDGVDFDQIAWRLGIDAGTVERRLAHAIRVIVSGLGRTMSGRGGGGPAAQPAVGGTAIELQRGDAEPL